MGQIVLDPRVSFPAREARPFWNPEAPAGIRHGLDEAAQGKTRAFGSFARYAGAG